MNHIQFGKFGEDLAGKYLTKKGYKVIERNFRNRYGEIDIIAHLKNYIVFIEVKTRKNSYYGRPSEAVDYRKQQKIIMLANNYINYKYLHHMQPRFDIIEIISDGKQFNVNHLENAF